MNDFDIIVIGAGPAGCYAALTAATKGLRVAIFEEHATIGLPRHDPGWLMETQFTKSLIDVVGKTVPWKRVTEFRVCDANTGELVEKSTKGGYLMPRDLLEKEIAALAIKAGALLYLKTKVTGFVRNQDKIEGVETNSEAIPVANAKIIVCADGIRSVVNGFAVNENLCKRGEVHPGVSYLLTNADVTGGIIEYFLSADPVLNRCFFTHSKNASYFSVSSSTQFKELKERDDNIVSRKIKNAVPLEISGYNRASSGKYGKYFAKMVQGNVIFVGDASGGAGNIHGMIQGQFAGSVAASAIKRHDVTEKRLTEYQELVHNTLAKAPFSWRSARDDFGSFDNWFRQVEEMTKGINATEISK